MYQSLYKKYRPRLFDNIVGQEKVVEVLKNQIKNDRTGHAYLFTGVRGTGKTIIAKIMAQAVNCSNLKDGNPCNECKICKSILEGNNTDIIEMDAASNNGVDDIRSIKDEISFLPTSSKYRVYIIDEVHMLSMGAFNALLKTLEEPPSHVKFILATTEPQKLPATIISRCQRFEFIKIDEEKIYVLLKKIAEEMNIKIEDNALKLISILARGSARDGISILESISNLSGEIKVKDVRNIIGMPETKIIINVFKNILLSDSKTLIKNINLLFNEGKEPITILTELLNVITACYLEESTTLSTYDEEERQMISKYFNLDKIEVYKIIKDILNIISDAKYVEDKKIIVLSGMLEILEKNRNNKYLSNSVKNIENINVENVLVKTLKEDVEVENKKETILEESIETDKVINAQKEETEEKRKENGSILKEEKVDINIENKKSNLEQAKENKEKIKKEEKNKKHQEETKLEKNIKVLDTLTFRKYMIQMQNAKMFVALSNAKIILENNENLKVVLTNESNPDNLEILNKKEALDLISKVAEKIVNKKVKVEYVF